MTHAYAYGIDCRQMSDAFGVCNKSLAHSLRVMTEWQEEGQLFQDATLLTVRGKSRFPTPYSNAVFPLRWDLRPQEVFDRAESLLGDRRYFIWARGDGGEFGAGLRERTFSCTGELPALAVEQPIEPGATCEPEVRRAESDSDIKDFVRVSELAYAELGLREGLASLLLARPKSILNSSTVAIARIEGRPVAAALSITDTVARAAGVYWVGTVPDFRRRGVGRAVTHFVTNAAFEQGATIVTLEASPLGKPVYLRMGFREVGSYTRFLSPSRTKSDSQPSRVEADS